MDAATMDNLDRIHTLHRILRNSRHPVPMARLAEELECTPRHVRRLIDTLRDTFFATLEYDDQRRGWHFVTPPDKRFEVPGLWLTGEELQSLSLLLNLLENLGNGLLNRELGGIEKQIRHALAKRGIDLSAFSEHIRVLPIAHRHIAGPTLQSVSDALLRRRRLHIHYTSFGRDRSERTISPQTLVYYRENWYLDAWCHKRNDLRTFAIARIHRAEIVDREAQQVPADNLRQHFAASYGIFAGPATESATLRCGPAIAHEIALQQWHPQQQGHWQGEDYILQLPYGDPRELLNDIMAHTPDMEVLAPAPLRDLLAARLAKAAVLYRQHDSPTGHHKKPIET